MLKYRGRAFADNHNQISPISCQNSPFKLEQMHFYWSLHHNFQGCYLCLMWRIQTQWSYYSLPLPGCSFSFFSLLFTVALFGELANLRRRQGADGFSLLWIIQMIRGKVRQRGVVGAAGHPFTPITIPLSSTRGKSS